jgi:hypothetical protein
MGGRSTTRGRVPPRLPLRACVHLPGRAAKGTEFHFSYRLPRGIYLAFRVLFPNQVIRADDLARPMVEVVVRRTRARGGLVFQNRDIRAMIKS